uniref:Uncharacterized protein n=1 Tax=Plectus sambesii TaxID=2011161 RepID=A0A914V070_9BILA
MNPFALRGAVMKRVPSVRRGPMTDFINKEDYMAMKTAQKSYKGSEQLVAQKNSAPILIPASSDSASKHNISKIEWNLVPQRTAALKKVASVQNGPLPEFKPKKVQFTQSAPNRSTQKCPAVKMDVHPHPQRIAALKKVASVQHGPLTDFKLKVKPEMEKKAAIMLTRKTVTLSIVKKASGRIFLSSKFNLQPGNKNLNTFKARLSNPGLIVIDDKRGNRLLVHDSLNMLQDSAELYSRQPGTLGAAMGPHVYPATIRANIVLSYVPSGSFEKVVKTKTPLCSSWNELGSYLRNARV